MDYGTFSGLYTLFLLLIFIGIIGWAFSKRRKQAFDEAAHLIFSDEPARQVGEAPADPAQGSIPAGGDKP